MFSALLSVLLLAVLPRSCDGLSANSSGAYIKSPKAHETPELGEKLSWVLMLYRSGHESNPGWDKDDPRNTFEAERLRKIDGCQRAIWPTFYTETGIEYLSDTLRAQEDQANMLAILEVLSASRLPSAVPVLEEFSTNADKAIARVAKSYLKRAQKTRAPK